MINRNTLLKLSMVAAVAAAAASPVLAQAAACAGPKVNWTSTSNTTGNLQCGQLSSRGESKGSKSNLPGVGLVTSHLYAKLIKGTHASAIAYNAGGAVLSGCAPFDDSTADGAKTVSGHACFGASQHQVVVVF